MNIVYSELDGAPILDKNYTSNQTILKKFNILKKYESSQIFEIFVYTNPKDPTNNVLRLMQPDWFFNIEYLKEKSFMNSYKKFVTDILMHIELKSENITEQINNLIDLQTKFEMVNLLKNWFILKIIQN